MKSGIFGHVKGWVGDVGEDTFSGLPSHSRHRDDQDQKSFKIIKNEKKGRIEDFGGVRRGIRAKERCRSSG